MTTTQTTKQPYLTVAEVAEEIGCRKRNVYRLIEEGKLKAIKRSERKTVVARWALEAYQRKLNNEPALVTERPPVDESVLLGEFAGSTGGLLPQAFYNRFKAGEIEDTGENMMLLVKAIALGAGGDPNAAPVAHDLWNAANARHS